MVYVYEYINMIWDELRVGMAAFYGLKNPHITYSYPYLYAVGFLHICCPTSLYQTTTDHLGL